MGRQPGRLSEVLGGVHPRGEYYGIDSRTIVLAYEHALVYTQEDIARLIATNRDFMWNGQIKNAKFQRVDGGQPHRRWGDDAGEFWTTLAPYDPTLRKIFEAAFNPDDWGGLRTPEWILRFSRTSEAVVPK